MTLAQKKILYFLLGLGISAVMLWLLFRNVHVGNVYLALKGANYWWLIPNIVFIVMTMYQRALRWRYMLAPIKQVAFSNLLAATCIGFMANNVLPLRLGEFVRAYSLASQDKGITKSASLATIFVERMVFDLVALLAILGGALYVSSVSLDESMRIGLKIAIGIALFGILAVLILAIKPEKSGSLLSTYLFFIPLRFRDSLEGIVKKFARGLEFLKKTRSVVSVAVQTLLIWLLMGLSNIFVFWVFGFALPLDASYVLLVVVSISILVPSSPGFIGVYHAGAVWSLMAYGISKEEALSCALVMHAVQYVTVTLMGLYFLKKEHLSLKKLEAEATFESST
jgi:uncharacterized protein (TIRG00374 family)